MTKPWLYYLICPASFVERLRDLAEQLGDGGKAEQLNFSTPISLAGNDTIVAYGGGTGPVGQETVEYLERTVLPTLPASVHWVRLVNEPYPARIARTSHVPTQSRIKSGAVVRWDMSLALEAVGMKIVAMSAG